MSASSAAKPSRAPTQVSLVKRTEGETLKIGPLTLRVLHDGSSTDTRIGAVSILIPPHTPGPPQHWHEMHDETFLVTKGTVTFTTSPFTPAGSVGDATTIAADVGDYVVVPPRSNHTFGNDGDVEAEVFCTLTPSFYVEYFRILAKAFEEGKIMDKDDYLGVMAQFATLPVKD